MVMCNGKWLCSSCVKENESFNVVVSSVVGKHKDIQCIPSTHLCEKRSFLLKYVDLTNHFHQQQHKNRLEPKARANLFIKN